MRSLLAAVAVALMCAGCATVSTVNIYHDMGVEHGEDAIETVEIENSGWLLFKFIPLGSGDPDSPNSRSCRFFTNTVTLQNNLAILENEMKRVDAKRIANLTSRKTDENVFIVLLTHRSYHTSAVLLK